MNRSTTFSVKCCVPICKNTTTNSKNKLFVHVREALKSRWSRESNIEFIQGKRVYCCEDHLNLQEDLENYHFWKLMKVKPILKLTAKLRISNMPTCSKYTSSDAVESPTLKSLMLQPIENLKCCEKENVIHKYRPTNISTSTHPVTIDAATQCGVKTVDKCTSTKHLVQASKPNSSKSSTSSYDIRSSPSLYGCTSESDSTIVYKKEQVDFSARKQILNFITSDSKTYIGLPKQYLWLISFIVGQSKTKIMELDIFITLFKIKVNDPVIIICNHFQISRVTFSKSFEVGIQVLASYFQNLIYLPSLLDIKHNQPLAFKIRFSNVCLIIDAFEIEIQKPHNSKSQAQTWSQYKNANTVKYLIGSTPNGYISYISKGYGGRTSDKALVEKSGFIDWIPHNAIILADRGFKEIEALLITKNVKLLRPPSVLASTKPTKEDIIQTKVVASLRVHIERVIRRVREFKLLKPHSVVSHKHVGYLNHIVLIACGLINLQNEIINSE